MRNLFISLSVILILVVHSLSQNYVDMLIKIQDQIALDNDSLSIDNYQSVEGNVKIFQITFDDENAYMIIFSKTYEDSLRRYNWIYPLAEKYTHAYYHWESDTVVKINLVNLDTNLEGPVIQIMGINNRSIMKIVTKEE